MHRGSWVDPEGEVNRYLGETLPEILERAMITRPLICGSMALVLVFPWTLSTVRRGRPGHFSAILTDAMGIKDYRQRRGVY